ncbi:tetratricopeptide repeat protein [Streptomyces sp. MZ04]|uniref:tetratricopeptide repeat protein n=1 Tax=Streptomyces sp. MZ04 TaxID=2559236 RepID=UPI00143286FE|nr:tetratricopeptide repeat protein [Streptomyces sp. MZ04]
MKDLVDLPQPVDVPHPVDPAVRQAHTDVIGLFRESRADGPAELEAVCRAARDRLAALPPLDAQDPRTWSSYALLTKDVQTLIGYLREAGVPSSEPDHFRALLIRVLCYLYEADGAAPGVLLAELVHRDWEARIGESHHDTLRALERLAACLFARGDAEKARPLFERVLLLRSRAFGDDDPTTLLAACNLGACMTQLGDDRAAFRLNDDTVRRCERRLGKDDETTILAGGNLASSLSRLGQLRKALARYRDIHQRRRRTSGENSLLTLGAEANVANTLDRLGDHDAARAINAALLPKFESAAGKDHSATKRTRGRLEANLRALGRDEEADEVNGGIPNF